MTLRPCRRSPVVEALSSKPCRRSPVVEALSSSPIVEPCRRALSSSPVVEPCRRALSSPPRLCIVCVNQIVGRSSHAEAWHRFAIQPGDRHSAALGVDAAGLAGGSLGRLNRSALPANEPVNCPWTSAGVPLTKTYRIPAAYWCGSSKVAVS